MTEKKQGQRMLESEADDSKGIKGEPAFTDEPRGEVAGHEAGRYIYCWRCWALNYVPNWASWFRCWACGALNRIW